MEPLTSQRIKDKFELRTILETAALRSAKFDTAALRALVGAAGGLGRHQAQIGHELARVFEAVDVAQFADRDHGGDELDPRRILDMRVGAGHHHLARFDRLAQGFQHRTRKFGELIHEQDAIMRQGYLARFRTLSPPTIAAIEAV